MIRNFILAGVLFLVSLVFGTRVAPEISARVLEELVEILQPIATLSPLGLFLVIFLNNSVKTIGAVILGIFFGLPPLFFVCFNGFILGALISELKPVVGYGVIAASILPHGVVEIPIMLLATALGFTVGWESLKWARRRRSAVRIQLRRGLKVYLRWLLPGLAIAAAIEVFATPFIIGLTGV